MSFQQFAFILILLWNSGWVRVKGDDDHMFKCFECNTTVDSQCLEKNPPAIKRCSFNGFPEKRCMSILIKDGMNSIQPRGYKGCFTVGYATCFYQFALFAPVDGKCLKRNVNQRQYKEFLDCLEKGDYYVDSDGRRSLSDSDVYSALEIALCSCKDKDLCNDHHKTDLESAKFAPLFVSKSGSGSKYKLSLPFVAVMYPFLYSPRK